MGRGGRVAGGLKGVEAGGEGGGAYFGSDQSATHAFLKLKGEVSFQEKPLDYD